MRGPQTFLEVGRSSLMSQHRTKEQTKVMGKEILFGKIGHDSYLHCGACPGVSRLFREECAESASASCKKLLLTHRLSD
jgi:hypothetical protein